jgi:hypothetical protein
MSKSHQQFIAVSVTAARLYAEKDGIKPPMCRIRRQHRVSPYDPIY